MPTLHAANLAADKMMNTNTNKSFQVRKAGQSDKYFVYQLEQTYWDEYTSKIWGEWQDEQFEKVWAKSGYEMVSLYGLPVGIFRVSRQDSSLYINAIHVIPVHRNVGIGSWILSNIEACAKLLHLFAVICCQTKSIPHKPCQAIIFTPRFSRCACGKALCLYGKNFFLG